MASFIKYCHINFSYGNPANCLGFLRNVELINLNFLLVRTKGTKTIQFTLDSPNEVQHGWSVKQKTSKVRVRDHRPKRAVTRQRKNIEERTEMFTAETLEKIKALATLRPLERRCFHNSGKIYLTILPDRTGYCRYVAML